MKRTPLQRRKPLRADPEKQRAFIERGRKPLARKAPLRSRRRRQSGTSEQTPHQRHREAVLESARKRYESGNDVECGLAFLGGECSGGWQADHVLEVRLISDEQSKALSRLLYGHTLDGDRALLEASLGTLIADGRNSWGALACEHHHNLKTRKLVDIPREHIPASVEEFARDYGLERLLDREFGERGRP